MNLLFFKIGCEKGFLLHDFKELLPNVRVVGVESSKYAISNSMDSVRDNIVHFEIDDLPFENHEFDLVIAVNIVYTKNLKGVIDCLREIEMG